MITNTLRMSMSFLLPIIDRGWLHQYRVYLKLIKNVTRAHCVIGGSNFLACGGGWSRSSQLFSCRCLLHGDEPLELLVGTSSQKHKPAVTVWSSDQMPRYILLNPALGTSLPYLIFVTDATDSVCWGNSGWMQKSYILVEFLYILL